MIVQAESEDLYTAEPLGKSELRVEASSEAEALRKLTSALRNWLESAKLIQVDVPTLSETPAPQVHPCRIGWHSGGAPIVSCVNARLARIRSPATATLSACF